MQAGWKIEPTVILTKQKIRTRLCELDIEYIFHKNTPEEVMLRLKKGIEAEQNTMAAKAADYLAFEVVTSEDAYGHDVVDDIVLCAVHLETDQELEKRKQGQQAHRENKEFKERLEYERLKQKFEKGSE